MTATDAQPERRWTAFDEAIASCDEDTLIQRTTRRSQHTTPPRVVADELGYVGGRWEPGERDV